MDGPLDVGDGPGPGLGEDAGEETAGEGDPDAPGWGRGSVAFAGGPSRPAVPGGVVPPWLLVDGDAPPEAGAEPPVAAFRPSCTGRPPDRVPSSGVLVSTTGWRSRSLGSVRPPVLMHPARAAVAAPASSNPTTASRARVRAAARARARATEGGTGTGMHLGVGYGV